MRELGTEEKLAAYGKPVKRLRFYMDIFVRVEAFLFVLAAVRGIFQYDAFGLWNCASTAILAAWAVLAALTVHDLEKSAFYINLTWLITWPALEGLSMLVQYLAAGTVLGKAASLLNAAGGSTERLQELKGLLVLSGIGSLLRLLVIAALCGFFARGLWRDREVFLEDIEELRAKLD